LQSRLPWRLQSTQTNRRGQVAALFYSATDVVYSSIAVVQQFVIFTIATPKLYFFASIDRLLRSKASTWYWSTTVHGDGFCSWARGSSCKLHRSEVPANFIVFLIQSCTRRTTHKSSSAVEISSVTASSWSSVTVPPISEFSCLTLM
jgi:hypothetical protein